MATVTTPAPIALSRYLTEDTKKIAEGTLKPALIALAYVITAIVSIAIAGKAVFWASLGQATLSRWATTIGILAGSALVTIGSIGKALETIDTWNMYKTYAKQLIEIENWDEEKIRQFFATHGIDTNEYTPEYMNLIRTKNEVPLKALLPLIARYLVAIERSEERTKMANQEKQNPNGKLDLYKFFTHRALFYKTEAAFYLQCLQKPSLAVPATDSL